MNKVTLADIARKTGYSVNTVSHALNNKPDISKKTKEYIIKTANEIGYIANTSAGALRSGKSMTIAIIIGDISNPHFSIMIKEIEARLHKYHYNALILNTNEDEHLERQAIISAISNNVDGIIICPVQKTTNNIDFLNMKKIPYTLIGRKFDCDKINYVVCDDVHSGKIAAEHMFNENREKILFLNGPSYVSGAVDRLAGIHEAYLKHNIPLSSLAVEETDIMSNDSNIKSILSKHSDCNAVICFSDLIAMNVCHILRQSGKKIPDDVSVIGFDNIASKFCFPVMLSSVSSSKTKMSIKTVDNLMKIIASDGKMLCKNIIPTRLILRETTKTVNIT